MSMPEENHHPVGEKGFMPGPGHLLRSAREAAGLTVRDVCARMRLDEPLLERLEDDRYEELPAPTFVRGYLRGYARLLDVPVGPVIEAYDRQGFEPPALVADIAERPQARSSDWTMQLITVLIVLLIVTSVVLWWQNQYKSGVSDSSSLDMTNAEVGAGVQTDGLPLLPPPSESDEPIVDGPGSDLAGPGDTVILPMLRGEKTTSGDDISRESRSTTADGRSETPIALPPIGSAATSGNGAARVPFPGQTAPGLSGGLQPNAATNGPNNTASNISSAGTASVDTRSVGQGRIESSSDASGSTQDSAPIQSRLVGQGTASFEFTRDSWLEIYDSTGKRLFYNIAKPGRAYNIQGQAPLRVIIGRPEIAKLVYNGKVIDLVPFTNAGVAKLTLRN